jgi:hypothetical protein
MALSSWKCNNAHTYECYMYDLHNAYNYENIVFIYYVQFSIRVSFACEFIFKALPYKPKCRLLRFIQIQDL